MFYLPQTKLEIVDEAKSNQPGSEQALLLTWPVGDWDRKTNQHGGLLISSRGFSNRLISFISKAGCLFVVRSVVIRRF